MRILHHPILGDAPRRKTVTINFDGMDIPAYEGEMIVAALLASGIKGLRTTAKRGYPRGMFCAIGRCTDCVMEVDGRSNVRTCVTQVRQGMIVRSQRGRGVWREA
jgi:predicted molibdopterin-dependent oxidoreductase YjgC